MKTPSDLKLKLERHFDDARRRKYQENLLWLKKTQQSNVDIYSKRLEFQWKYNADENVRVCPYLRDFTPILLGYLYEQYVQKPQVKSAGRLISSKVSAKHSSEFQGSFVYDQQRNAYYQLGETLGRGSCGTGPNKVKKAVNLETGEVVVIKIIRGCSNDFEISILKLLDRYRGDLLVPSMKYGLINQYIIQTFVRGKSFLDYDKTNPNPTPEQIRDIVKLCFEKLVHYHHLGIIILDIKKDNILYDPSSNQLEFIDFGLSRLILRDSSGNINMLYDDGKTTKTLTIDHAQLIVLKNDDIRLMHQRLKEIFSKHLTTELAQLIDKLRDNLLIPLSPGQEAKPLKFR